MTIINILARAAMNPFSVNIRMGSLGRMVVVACAAFVCAGSVWASEQQEVRQVQVAMSEPFDSNSEIYKLTVGPRVTQSPDFGVPIDSTFYLVDGTTYPITLGHVATRPGRLTDYDYSASVDCECGIVEDPEPILGSHGWDGVTGEFQAAGAEATLIIPRIDQITVSVVDSDPPREVPAPGETAQLRAEMLPEERESVWTLVAVEPDQPQGQAVVVTPESVPNGVDLHVHSDSGSGWVRFLIHDSALLPGCGIVRSFRVGCDSCGAPGAADASCSSSCGANAVACPFGDFDAGNGSVNMSFGVGLLGRERGGLIRLYADTPSTNLAKLTTLDFSAIWGPNIHRIGFTNDLRRQLLVPHGLVDMVQDTDFKYTLRFYLPGDKGIRDDCTGYFEPDPGDSLRTYVVENPSENFGQTNTLRITENPGVSQIVTEYLHVKPNAHPSLLPSGWLLQTGNQLRKEKREDEILSNDRERFVTKVSNNAGTFSYRAEHIYGTNLGARLLLEETLDPQGASNTTHWTYYDDPEATGAYGRVASVLYPDGNWRRHQYDALGRLTNTVEAFKNALPTAAADEAVETRYSYDPLPDSDDADASHDRFSPRRVERRTLGVTTRLNYTVYGINGEGERMIIREQCLSAEAEYGDTNNLRRVTLRYAPDAAAPAGGRLKSVTHLDGTLDTYTYELGAYTPDADPAQSVFTPGEGTHLRTTLTRGTVAHPEGLALRTTRTRTVTDVHGAELLRETEVYTGTDFARIDWAVSTHDALGRRVAVDHADGTRQETEWACCGLERERDRAGLETEYVHDDLKRPILRVRLGAAAGLTNDLFTSYTYDASGRVLLETRTGSGLSLVSSNAYDLAGRRVKQVDPAGLITTYAYAAGGRFTTNTLPGGATVITERYRDGRTREVSGTGAIATYHDHGVYGDGTQWTTTWTGPLGEDSPAWTRTVTDLLGRTIREERPGFGGAILTNAFVYDAAGRLALNTSPGLADTLHLYDELGERVLTGLDVDGNGLLELAGPDRVTETYGYHEYDGTNWWRVRYDVVYPVAGAAAGVTQAVHLTRLTGLSTNLTALAVTRDALGNATVAETAVAPGARQTVQTVRYPDSATATRQESVNGLVVAVTDKSAVETAFAYDGLGRQLRIVLARTGTNHVGYNALGQVEYREDAAGHRTEYAYDAASGRQTAVTDALSHTVYTAYDAQGRVTNTWGATYPVAYAYDDYGRLASMWTWRDDAGAPDATHWLHDEATGLLTNKVYADGQGPRYAYSADGRLATRTWARGVVTTYTYTNTTGELLAVVYSDDTPDVVYAHDRLGRPTRIDDGEGERIFAYDPSTLRLTNETLVVASVTNRLTRLYDELGRTSGMELGADYRVGYLYDTAGRLGTVTGLVSGVGRSFAYSYVPASHLVAGYDSGNLSVRRIYEPKRDLIVAVSNLWSGGAISTFHYLNDAVGRRTVRFDDLALTNAFGYNVRSELVSALMDTNSFTYGYDAIGNRTAVTNNAEVLTYLSNALNQYTNIANGVTNSPIYDADGNLLAYGDWGLDWDGENRLVGMTNGVTDLTFAYDYMSRRIAKATDGVTNRFRYDGWAMIREESPTATNAYVYGLDLSGSPQGAGTIGGILAALLSGTSVFYAYDGNGNVTDLINASGTTVAQYAYDPYGNVLTQSGAFADDNPFRFSTKYTDQETGLVYYGYRYYNPEIGRWVNRDPIEEQGGLNVYGFTQNRSIDRIDILGMLTVSGDCGCYTKKTLEVYFQIESVFNPLVDPIREPFGSAIRDHFDKMHFKCRSNAEYPSCSDKLGDTPQVGVFRNIEYTYVPSPGASATIELKKNWRTTAFLCVDQLDGKSLNAWLRTAIHETAHNVGWGNHYEDAADSSFDNKAPSGPDEHHRQADWKIPTGN